MKEKLAACVDALETLIQENEDAVTAADAVTALLKKLPADTSRITALDVEAITAARDAYNELSKDELKLLDKADVKQLTACEKTLSKNQKAADKVQALIDKLPEADTVREELRLLDSKAVSAAEKAFNKLTEDQKTFLKEGSEEKLTANVDRMAVLTENQADIKKAEKLIKSLPTAEKIKASDRTKLENAKAAYQKVTDSEENLTIAPDLAEKLEASKLAFETYEQDAQTFREEALGLLPETVAEVFASDEDAITNARAQYKLLSKNVRSFIEKDELSHLTACEKTLKKNKSAAAKVDKLILKLPEEVTQPVSSKTQKAVDAANTAYEKLSEAAQSFVENYERLELWLNA